MEGEVLQGEWIRGGATNEGLNRNKVLSAASELFACCRL
jgi:hypothetical protein